MKSNDIKILTNMAETSMKIEEKEVLGLIDYFYIFNLIEGYQKINDYFLTKKK